MGDDFFRNRRKHLLLPSFCYKHNDAIFQNFCNSNISCFFANIKLTLHQTISRDSLSFSSHFAGGSWTNRIFFYRKSCTESRGSFHVSPSRLRAGWKQKSAQKRQLRQVRQVARKLQRPLHLSTQEREKQQKRDVKKVLSWFRHEVCTLLPLHFFFVVVLIILFSQSIKRSKYKWHDKIRFYSNAANSFSFLFYRLFFWSNISSSVAQCIILCPRFNLDLSCNEN